MITPTHFSEIYLRDIKKLHDEISAYQDDASLWVVKGGIANSAGNLALHLIGNLNHFIGATLGHTGYVRNRDAEFNTKNVSKTDLLKMLDEVEEVVSKTLGGLTENNLQKEYPFDFAGKQSTAYYLMFFIAHFEYHLGQINYHRRLI
jgi:uncharacterized damage-inducible protein DinB